MQLHSPSQIRIHQEYFTPPPLNFNDESPSTSHLGKWKEREGEPVDNLDGREGDPEESDEGWEAELDESLSPGITEIQDWLTLRAQIKEDLEKKAKSL